MITTLIDPEGPPPPARPEPRRDTPEHRLVLALLEQAVADLGDPRRWIRDDARRWFDGAAGDAGVYGTLAHVADVTGIRASVLRRWARLVAELPPRRAVVG